MKQTVENVYFSALLPKYYPVDSVNLFTALAEHGVHYDFLEGTKDVWVRDFMPIVRARKFQVQKCISFKYEPSYLRSTPELRTDFAKEVLPYLQEKTRAVEYVASNINLDGGNVVISPDETRAIISDRIFRENADLDKKILLRTLEEILEMEMIIIPSLLSDMTGHADGMVRFVDDFTLACNRPLSPYGLERKVKKALGHHGLDTVDFPYKDSGGYSAVGCYLNFLETEQTIFLPIFGIANDEEALRAAKCIFSKEIVPVQIPHIAAEGGGLHCVSWQMNVRKNDSEVG